jgi:hypothetical protein
LKRFGSSRMLLVVAGLAILSALAVHSAHAMRNEARRIRSYRSLIAVCS